MQIKDFTSNNRLKKKIMEWSTHFLTPGGATCSHVKAGRRLAGFSCFLKEDDDGDGRFTIDMPASAGDMPLDPLK